MERLPKSGELYRHFKNKLYQVVTVAVHSETGEKLVIYQALYGDYQVYARPLGMFVGEVDREKYPDAAQKYRFERIERIERENIGARVAAGSRREEKTNAGNSQAEREAAAAGSRREEKTNAGNSQAEMEAAAAGSRREEKTMAGNSQTEMKAVAAGRWNQGMQRGQNVRILEKPDTQKREDSGGQQEKDDVETVSATESGVSPRLMAFFDADDLQEKYNILLSMRDEVTDHMINNMAVVLDVVIPEGETDDRYEALKRCIRTKQRYETDRLR